MTRLERVKLIGHNQASIPIGKSRIKNIGNGSSKFEDQANHYPNDRIINGYPVKSVTRTFARCMPQPFARPMFNNRLNSIKIYIYAVFWCEVLQK